MLDDSSLLLMPDCAAVSALKRRRLGELASQSGAHAPLPRVVLADEGESGGLCAPPAYTAEAENIDDRPLVERLAARLGAASAAPAPKPAASAVQRARLAPTFPAPFLSLSQPPASRGGGAGTTTTTTAARAGRPSQPSFQALPSTLPAATAATSTLGTDAETRTACRGLRRLHRVRGGRVVDGGHARHHVRDVSHRRAREVSCDVGIAQQRRRAAGGRCEARGGACGRVQAGEEADSGRDSSRPFPRTECCLGVAIQPLVLGERARGGIRGSRWRRWRRGRQAQAWRGRRRRPRCGRGLRDGFAARTHVAWRGSRDLGRFARRLPAIR